MLNHLCAVRWSNLLLDGVVLLFLIGYVLLCAKRGFIDCFFDFVSTGIALIASLLFTKLLLTITGGLFGLQDVIAGGLTQSFAKIKGFDIPVSADGFETAVSQKNFAAILANLAVKWFAKEQLAADTTIAMLLGDVTAGLLCLLLTAIFLFAVTKLLLLLLRETLETIIDRITLLDAVNTVIGAALGFLQGLLIVSVILAILALIPSAAISNYLSRCPVSGWLFNNNPLVWFLGLLL